MRKRDKLRIEKLWEEQKAWALQVASNVYWKKVRAAPTNAKLPAREDIDSIVLTTLAKKIREYQPGRNDNFQAYAYSSVAGAVLSEFRRAHRREGPEQTLTTFDGEEHDIPAEHMDLAELQMRMRASVGITDNVALNHAIQKLPSVERRALIAIYFQRFEYPDLVSRFGGTITQWRAALMTAIERLRGHLMPQQNATRSKATAISPSGAAPDTTRS